MARGLVTLARIMRCGTRCGHALADALRATDQRAVVTIPTPSANTGPTMSEANAGTMNCTN